MSGGLTVTGSPAGAFANALYQRLAADATLATLVGTRIYGGDPPHAARPTAPYISFGPRTAGDFSNAMQREGLEPVVQIDVWSDSHGPDQVQTIQSRIRALLQRQPLTVVGFDMFTGSLKCTLEMATKDADPDMPDTQIGYHGVQQWTAILEERV